MGNRSGKTLMLLPGTACDYQTNFGTVLERLGENVNYDGFDGNDLIFPDMITITEKIEKYIKDNYDGKIDGAIGSSLGSSFEKKKAKTREKLKSFFEMNDETADRFMACFSKFKPESIRNEYYTDLLTHLNDDIHVEGTKVHFIYANKMGEKYLKRYKKYFRDPDIREFNMQHEQWLFGGEQYTAPVLKAINEFMESPAG